MAFNGGCLTAIKCPATFQLPVVEINEETIAEIRALRGEIARLHAIDDALEAERGDEDGLRLGAHDRPPERTGSLADEDTRSCAGWRFIRGVFVYLDDVDKHYEVAKAAGAKNVHPQKDQPYGRTYRATDPEGHPWFFTSPPKAR